MAKAAAKTTENTVSVENYVKTAVEEERQKDCFGIIDIMRKQSGFEPKMWGPAIIGFGKYHYKYESGHEGDAPMVGFAARKNEFALYIANFDGKPALLEQLGKHKTSKSCVYIKKLADVDASILGKLVAGSVKHYETKYK